MATAKKTTKKTTTNAGADTTEKVGAAETTAATKTAAKKTAAKTTATKATAAKRTRTQKAAAEETVAEVTAEPVKKTTRKASAAKATPSKAAEETPVKKTTRKTAAKSAAADETAGEAVAAKAPAKKTAAKKTTAKAKPEAKRGRPGRKAKVETTEDDLVGDSDDDSIDEEVAIAESYVPPASVRGKGKARDKAMKEALNRSYAHHEEDDKETRLNKLKALIRMGKERGYLTYSEVNDHMPENIVDPDQIDQIISTLADLGIQVYEQAPTADDLLIGDSVPTASDDAAEEEAEAALATVDSEFGRTTDPVRMYMREMGSVELLTREGEIEIAKRIEDGLKHMVHAISGCPTTIVAILEDAEKVRNGTMQIDQIVDGLVDGLDEEASRWLKTTKARTLVLPV